jgi:hypothetical protein
MSTIASLMVKIGGDAGDLSQKLKEAKSALASLAKAKVEVAFSAKAASQGIADMREKIKGIKAEIKLQGNNDDLKEELAAAKTELASLQEQRVSIRADLQELNAAIKASKKNLGGLEKEARAAEGALQDLAKQGQSIGKGILAGVGAAAVALAGLGAASVKMASDMEGGRIALSTFLGSADKAGVLLKDLEQLTYDTNFDLPGLVDASKQLAAFGFKVKEIAPLLSDIGKASTALGGGVGQLDRLVSVLGKMKTSGEISGKAMAQLAKEGIPA